MRVIAGSARRLLLKAPPGYETRPTSDKIKETLFNMLMPYIYTDTVFLDLYSGSGGIGIEALSRGAKGAVFVENSKQALSCIKENINKTGFADRSEIIGTDVLTALHRMEGREHFDIIFMDPPYEMGYEKAVLEYLAASKLAGENTLIITEASVNTDFDYVDRLPFDIVKYKKYKNNCHLFLKRRAGKGREQGEESNISGEF
ncbi:MAG: 16S rRNA (guanine(966)-N(2))-methyltransferase RsmD [Lachnospiraceae bacterium]|nr:16S rRNA (guanine(966)-N(2))-methyltransferase RsmD [Lachnospiraceae bacterium]